MIPAKPSRFAPDAAPDWCELKLDAYRNTDGTLWWVTRPRITPRLQLVHTNGATGEGSIESAINWGNASPSGNTHPHYQVDRGRAAKLVPTDRKGIGNATTLAAQAGHGNVSDWSIVIETSDAGWPTPGNAGGFIGEQVQMIAEILAYESILHAIPLDYPTDWFGPGTAAHTEPYGYPYWTIKIGKPCPGDAKKRELREVVLPLARRIRDAWTATPEPAPVPIPTPDPLEEPMILIDDTRLHGVFTLDGVPVSGEALAALTKQGAVIVKQDHAFWRSAILHRNGAQTAVLYTEHAATFPPVVG
jgi:hypothetical protein